MLLILKVFFNKYITLKNIFYLYLSLVLIYLICYIYGLFYDEN